MSTPTDPWRKSALLWGVVGALAFLTLHQGYLLFGGEFLGFGPVALLTTTVFAVGATTTYLLEPRLRAR